MNALQSLYSCTTSVKNWLNESPQKKYVLLLTTGAELLCIPDTLPFLKGAMFGATWNMACHEILKDSNKPDTITNIINNRTWKRLAADCLISGLCNGFSSLACSYYPLPIIVFAGFAVGTVVANRDCLSELNRLTSQPREQV